MAFLPKCQRTSKEANSSGVGFLWPKHIVAQSLGKVLCDTIQVSIEVEVKNTGFVLVVSFYGVFSMPKDSRNQISSTIGILNQRGGPFITLLDFNSDSAMCERPW
jgi:hypothetical protein